MASLGIDYGTGSWKLALIEGPRVLALKQFEEWPQLEPVLKEMDSHHPGLPIVLPSGFGIPVKRIQEVDDRDLFEMTLRRGDPTEKGLGHFLQTLRASDFHAYCIPSVKLLPSVPIHRKVNRIDMGTADKLCAVAYLLHHQLALGESLDAQDFLSLEVGEAFKALIVVQGGRLVDGLGGTAGHMGPRTRGAVDGELAYLYSFDKAKVYSGGGLNTRFGQYGEDAFWEGLEKEIVLFLNYYGLPRILLTGRRKEAVIQRLGTRYPMVLPLEEGKGFEAALGAAILADGIAGGQLRGVADHLGLRDVRERVLDWIEA
ncbi:MAG: DUF1464 family protein [Candidatus Methylomirabilales bacterium]